MLKPEELARELTTQRLVDAITGEHFVLYGQAIMPVATTRRSFGYVEVLVRYVEEERNLLPPGGFFEVLEELNLMSVLDRWVLHRVIRSLVGQYNLQNVWDVPQYSVNLSVDSLYVEEFSRLVGEYFQKYQIPRDKLRFELDESEAQTHRVEFKKLTSALAPIGCGFTLTAYTGDHIPPGSLAALGVDSVKIECSLIVSASTTAGASSRGQVHRSCKAAGMRVIAEFVEETKTLAQLHNLGIDYVQGFAVSRPAPLKTITKVKL